MDETEDHSVPDSSMGRLASDDDGLKTAPAEEAGLEVNEEKKTTSGLLVTGVESNESSSQADGKPNGCRQAEVIVRQIAERNVKEECGKWPPDEKQRKITPESNRMSMPHTDITKRLRAKFEVKTEAKLLEKPVVNTNRRSSDLGVSASDMCYICNKRVYPMEKMEINKHKLHKNCFKCSQCLSSLRLNNYTFSGDKLYCITHFKQIFLTKGNYDEGFGREQHKDKWTHKN